MQGWHGTYLGLREIPRELSEFELQAFFTFSSTERAWVQRRRGPALRLGLALHIGFVRMSGRPLDAFRVLPSECCPWRFSGTSAGSSIFPSPTSRHCEPGIAAAARCSSINSSPAGRWVSEG